MDCSETVIIVNAVSMCSFRIHVQCNLFDSLTTDQCQTKKLSIRSCIGQHIPF